MFFPLKAGVKEKKNTPEDGKALQPQPERCIVSSQKSGCFEKMSELRVDNENKVCRDGRVKS